MGSPLKTFIIYSSSDRELRAALERQLKSLIDNGLVDLWSDKEILPGELWDSKIKKELLDAELFLMLISADFFNSDYIREQEFIRALEKLERGEALVIPIIVRDCDWEAYPEIKKMQVLPPGGTAVTDLDFWKTTDKAWATVIREIRHRIEALRAEQAEREIFQEIESQKVGLEKATAEQRKKQEYQAAERAEYEKNMQAPQQNFQQSAFSQGPKIPASPLRTFAFIGSSLLVLFLVWMLVKNCKQGNQQLAQTEQPTTAQSIENQEKSNTGPSSDNPSTDSKTLSPIALPENLGPAKTETEKQSEKTAQNSNKKPSEPDPVTPQKNTTKTFGADRKSGFEMVKVQGGTFTMGSPTTEIGRDDDECQHSVTVRSFSIGKYEVTQSDWREVMGSDPPDLNFKGCDQCPVESVSWDDIQKFIKKLRAQTGQNFRLPTEAEWEFAARGGNKSKGFIYSGGNDVGAVAWVGGVVRSNNSSSKTHPVGGKKANELGIFDMSGNVWEWCDDIYKVYLCDGKSGGSGASRVLRGGSWLRGEPNCRAADRNDCSPTIRGINSGFRLACSF